MKSKFIFVYICILSVCFISTSTHANASDEIGSVPNLKEFPGFLKYEDPTAKGILYARMLRIDNHLVMELYSQAYNFHGVEAVPEARTEKEKQQVEKASAEFVNNPEQFISFLPKFVCTMEHFGYESEPMTDQRQAAGGASSWYINVVTAKYEYSCTQPDPEAIIIEIFSAFPNFEEISIQLIENDNKMRKIKLTPDRTMIKFKSN